MPATWPESLPQALNAEGYARGTGDGRLRSPTDTGPGKVRRRSSAVARPLSGAMNLSTEQKEALDAFVADDLADGTLPFDFPNQEGAGTILVRFSLQGALPSYSYVVQDYWRASIELEVLP